MTRVCVVKLFHYESQEHLKRKKILECKDCPIKCKNKEEQHNE